MNKEFTQNIHKKKIEIIPVKSIYDVLYHALKDGKKKDKLLSQIKKEIA